MNTENLSTLKIHKLTQAQYDRELAAGRISPSDLYLTPDDGVDLSDYTTHSDVDNAIKAIDFPVDSVNGKTGAVVLDAHDVGADANGSASTALANAKVYTDGEISEWVGDRTVAAQISSAIATKADSGHTHKYAGSSSAGGAATSADKLNTNAGSSTQPVYFSNGKPVATTYTLGKSVPSDAKFTDTTYTLGSFGITANATELNYCDGVTSNIQTQLNGKASSSHSHDYASSGHTHTAAQVGAAPASHSHDYASSGHSHTAAQVGALSTSGGTMSGSINMAWYSVNNIGRLILTTDSYGTGLPSAGNKGRLFFKKV